MSATSKRIKIQWKRAMRKRKIAEQKAVALVTKRLLGQRVILKFQGEMYELK